MLEIAFIAFIVLVGVAGFLFYSHGKSLRKIIAEKEQEIETLNQNIATQSKEMEQLRMKEVELQTEVKSLTKNLEKEETAFKEREKELKEQVQMIGENLLQKGTKLLQEENKSSLSNLLTPFKEKLQTFEKEVKESKEKGVAQHSSLKEVLNTLSKQHNELHSTAQNLVNALKGEQKTQGNWGELALKRILETSGLEEGREYETQDSFKDEQGNRKQPDVVVYLPEEKHLIVDAKVSLKAFEEYINADDEAAKKNALDRHLISIKNHIKTLGSKDYDYLQDLSSPEFVLLFIPLESSFALAVKEEPTLYQMAWEKRVILVTPSTLLATLKTVSSLWKQEKQSKNAIEIAEQAGRLYDKFVGFLDSMEKIGKKQEDASEAYEEAMKRLTSGTGDLISRTEKLKELGVKTKKNIDKKYLEDGDE